MTVKAILSSKGRNVVTVSPTITLSAATRVLAENRIGAVVVTDSEKRVVGILSERDLVRVIAEQGEAALNAPVESAMTRKVITCSDRDTVGEIMEKMTTGKFRHVPVVEDGRLAGVISIGDVVKYRLSEMEQESNALREYILTA